jgi:H+/gluconate symporter-like permease
MDPSTLSIIGIVLSLAFIVVFALRGWHIIILAPMAVIFVAAFSGLDILPTLTGPYMKGFVSYAGKFYLIFLMGSLFGKVMEDSGAARAIAEGILKVVGRGNPMNGVMAVALIGVALTYGGVSLFVVIFALIPIGRPIFKELNLPWHLFVIPYAFSIGSITMTMLPGSPQILNIMPTKYMASSTMSAPLLGILGAVVVAAFNVFYFKYQLKKAQARGEGYVAPSGVGVVAGEVAVMEKLPNVWLSIVPMIVVVVMLNAFKLDAVYALGGGVVACLAFFWKYFKNILDTLNKGAVNTVIPIVNTCADVGYGMAIAATAGFKVIAAWLLTLPMHPIVSLAIATNMMAGITGSASGGLGIILETLAPKYLALGLSPDLIHRVATMSAGCFDALPHNGVVITFLAVTGLTHMNGYKHIWWGHIVATVIALLIVIPLGIMIY